MLVHGIDFIQAFRRPRRPPVEPHGSGLDGCPAAGRTTHAGNATNP